MKFFCNAKRSRPLSGISTIFKIRMMPDMQTKKFNDGVKYRRLARQNGFDKLNIWESTATQYR